VKYYKARLYSEMHPEKYLVWDKELQGEVKEDEIKLCHAHLEGDLIVIEPGSFHVSKEELKWNYFECAGIPDKEKKYQRY
jgi:hypothetical protein